VLRGLLQMLTDLAIPIIPALFVAPPTMPLLLADKASIDCHDGAVAATPRIAEAVRAASAPVRREPAGMRNVFLSYANQDGKIAEDVFRYLSSHGFSVWFDRLSILPGSNVPWEIERALERADVMVALIAPASSQSPGIRDQWTFFANTLKKPVIPVLTGETRVPYIFARTQPIDLTRTQPFALAQLVEAIRTRLDQPQSENLESEMVGRPPSREQPTKDHEDWLKFVPKPRPLGVGEKWHVYLSYSSAYRRWMLNLYDTLRQHGFEVVMERSVFDIALAQCQSGTMIWSDNIESNQREYEYLKKCAMEKATFRLVLLLLDTSSLPPFPAGSVVFNFSAYPDGPNGGELLRLLYALTARKLPAEAARFANDQEAVALHAGSEIGAAIRNRDPEFMMEIFHAGGVAWRMSATLGCKTAEGLIQLRSYDEAVEILVQIEREFPRAIRPRQLRALALARRGRPTDLRQAQHILGALYEAGERDPETLGIYGRTWMDRYALSEDLSDLRQARDLYAEAFDRAPDDFYAGINAAANSVLLDPAELSTARRYARRVLRTDAVPRVLSFLLAASKAEAHLIVGDYFMAAKAYGDAIEMTPSETWWQQTSWKQACRLLNKLNPAPEERKAVRAVFAHLPDCEEFAGENQGENQDRKL
jgi:tetratricopeptide (TPR) repeat protein